MSVNDPPSPRAVDTGTSGSTGLDLGGEAKKLLKNPKAYVLGLVAGWIVTNLVILPAKWVAAWIAFLWNAGLTTIDTTVRSALGGTGSVVYMSAVGTRYDPGAVWQTYLSIGEGLRAAGFAGPIVGTLAAVIMLSIAVGIVVLLARVVFNLSGGVLVS